MPRAALTDTQRRLLYRAQREGGVMRTLDAEDGVHYSTASGGRANKTSVEILINKRYLVPAGDGLFPEESQIFMPAEGLVA